MFISTGSLISADTEPLSAEHARKTVSHDTTGNVSIFLKLLKPIFNKLVIVPFVASPLYAPQTEQQFSWSRIQQEGRRTWGMCLGLS